VFLPGIAHELATMGYGIAIAIASCGRAAGEPNLATYRQYDRELPLRSRDESASV
jgi:hypothetical protein